MGGKLAFLLCENLRREMGATLGSEGFEDVGAIFFSGNCCGPQIGLSALASTISAGDGEGFDRLDLIAGACCAGLGIPPEQLGNCRVHTIRHCSNLFIDSKASEKYLNESICLMPPGELAGWKSSLNKRALDRESALHLLGRPTRLAMIDTGVDSEAIEHLQALAAFVGLPCEVVSGGVDQFRLFLQGIVLKWRLEAERAEAMGAMASANRQSSEYAMVADLIANLATVMTEREATEAIFDVFTTLFAPSRLIYVSLQEGRQVSVITRPPAPSDAASGAKRLIELDEGFAWTESGKGFRLRVDHQGETLSVLEIDDVAFPAYKEHYLNLARTIGKVCGLAIANARKYERIRRTEEDRERLLLEIEHRAVELDAANKELEAFVHSVSHDLRAPLRHIDGFSLALLEDCADNLDARGKEYLQFVREGSQNMAEIIDALLSLSRVSRGEVHHDCVDLSAMARAVSAELQSEQPERSSEFIVAPEVIVRGDSRLLRIALENLLGNAWKFSSKRQHTRIEFGITRQQGEVVYYVRDNGAGFDMTYADKLFGPFQRLHNTGEFPGTGIGLATVQRIIHRHGGRIWADGKVHNGATLYFTLGS